MWPFDDEPELDEVTSDFNGVGQSIAEAAETEEAGLQALQDAYKSYEFEDSTQALNLFQEHSNEVRKKFGDTKAFDFNTTMDTAPRNFEEFTSDLPDPDENKIDIINQWETQNLAALSESTDLNYKQIQPQLERGIKQAATLQRRQIYGSDNYLVTDQALRMGQGLVGPIADLVGADSVNDFFTENTDPDGSSVFGYTVGGDDSYWSAISSGVGSVAGAVGSGLATGGWGTVAYLGASGAGSVRARVEDSLENEASTGEALAAGGIEAVSQGAQVLVGSKVFGGAVSKILGKSEAALGERVFPKLLKAAGLEGSTEAGGQVVSNVGQNVGRGDELDKDLLAGVPESFVAGAVGGGLAAGGAEVFAGIPDAKSEAVVQPPIEELDARAAKDLADPGEDDGEVSVPKEGTTKLYRAEGGEQGNGVPDWMNSGHDQFENSKAAEGRWFTDSLEEAEWYIKNEYPNGKIVTVDVPTSEVEKYRVSNSKASDTDNPAKYSARPDKEFFLPSELAAKKTAHVSDQADPILEIDGLPPPKSEAIPGKAVSTELLEPGTSVAKLSDGSEIVESDGKKHLVKDGHVLQSYEVAKNVSPENFAKVQQLVADGNPDGTAVTVTTDGENLLIESEFVKDDLTPSTQKTGKTRVAIPLAESGLGSNTIFASKTRTTDDVRQNPFFLAPGTVESTVGAAKAGFGDQYTTPYMKRMMEKFGPDLSEELGLSVESFEENADGTVTSVQTPLQTKFKTTHAETGDDAAQFINERGIIGSLDYLNSNNKFNKTDVGVANIAVSKLQQLYSKLQKEFSENQSPKSLNKLAQAGDLLNQAIVLKDKVGTSAGQSLGSLTNVADTIHNSRAKGEFRISQIENELTKKAYEEYQKTHGEEVNINGWAEEAQVAEKELKQAESENKPKEGEAISEAGQAKIKQAKEKYDAAVNKIKAAEKIKQEKLSDLTPETRTNLVDMYELLGSLDGEMKLTYAQKVFDEEARLGIKDIDPDRFEQIYNFYRSNLLSGPSTQLRNLVGNTSKFVSDIVGLIGTGEFKMAGVYLDAWVGESGTSLKEAKEIVKGHRAGRYKFDQKATDSKGNVRAISSSAPLTNPFTAIQNAMYRLLTAQDAVFYRNSNSAMANLAEYVASKNLPVAERKAYIEKALGYDQQGDIRSQVEKEAKLLRDAGMEVNQDQIDLDVAYRTEKLRSEKTRETADKFGDRSVFVNDPTGLMGAFYSSLDNLSEKISVPIGGTEVKPMKFLLPFTRVAANVTSHIMEFTPVGVFKGLVNNPDAPANTINHALGDIDAKMVLGRGLVGTSFMAGFFAFAHAFKDDDDPYIQFFGYPPKGKYKEWQAKGIDPFSMKIGDNIIPLQGTSLAVIPAIIGGGMEQLKAGASITDVIKSASMASVGAVSTMSFLKPAGELFDYLMGSKDAVNLEAGKSASGSTEKRRSNFLKSQVDTVASGFIPASGFLNNLGRWTNESPVESYNNLAAKVFGEMPFTKAAGITDKEPQLNIFGEPITKSLTQRMSAGLAPHTIKTDPVLLWMQETGFDIPDQGPIVSLTRKVEKENFGESQKNITGYSGIMDEAQSRRVLQISGPRIKDFLDSIRKDPNFQVKGEKAQKFIDTKVNEIRAEAKLIVLSN